MTLHRRVHFGACKMQRRPSSSSRVKFWPIGGCRHGHAPGKGHGLFVFCNLCCYLFYAL